MQMKYLNSKTMAKVIHVHLIFEKIDRYFGSISAIYGTFSADQIGIQQSTLQHKGLTDGGSVITKRAIIKQAQIIRCRQK